MLPNSPTRRTFLSRILGPAGMFVLLLSFAVNAFFILTRNDSGLNPAASSSSSSQSSLSSSALGPVAFGVVSRPVFIRPQSQSASGIALKPVKNYIVPSTLFSETPASLPVYRDQGAPLVSEYFTALFSSVRSPIDPLRMQLLPETYSFKSADNALKVTLSLPARTLSIVRSPESNVVPPPERAEDSEILALANTFAASLNIDLSAFGAPVIQDTPMTKTQPKRTFVVWPMKIDGMPVIDPSGVAVPALTMQVGRVAHRALNATLSLLKKDVLAVSPYPTLKKESIQARLSSGGMLPLPRSPKGQDVTYSDSGVAYLLMQGDDQYPTYLLPVLRASFSFDGKKFSTFVPLLDRKSFDWKEQPAS